MIKQIRKLIVCAVIVLMGAGCSLPEEKEHTGSLSVIINEKQSRNFLPALSMEPVSYILSGTGPRGGSFQETLSNSTSFTVQGISLGEWVVTASALNIDGTVIARAEGTVTVVYAAPAYLNLILKPLEGPGSLGLTINWPSDAVLSGEISAVLTPQTGPVENLNLTVDNTTGTAFYNSAAVDAGYYTLTVQLLDNGFIAAGTVELVRIVEGQLTQGEISFTHVNQAPGDFHIGILSEMDNPLDIVISGGAESKGENETMTLTAEAVGYTGNITCIWYVNGEAKGSGSSFIFDSSWPLGYYNIDVIAFNSDGSRGGRSGISLFNTEPVKSGQYIYTATIGAEDFSWGEKYWEEVDISSDGLTIAALGGTSGGADYFYLSLDGGQTWSEKREAGLRYFEGLDMSEDGSVIALAEGNSKGNIVVSRDSGMTWSNSYVKAGDSWNDIEFSLDDSWLYACSRQGNVAISGDKGVTWQEYTIPSAVNLYRISGSCDGQVVGVATTDGNVYISVDGGSSWSHKTSLNMYSWNQILVSPDGNNIYVNANISPVYESQDRGLTWSDMTQNSSGRWKFMKFRSNTVITALDNSTLMSYDTLSKTWSAGGNVSSNNGFDMASDNLTLVSFGSSFVYLKKSSDGGSSWIDLPTAGSAAWKGTALSADGQKMAAVNDYGYLHLSQDRGATWSKVDSLGNNRWHSVDMSADGRVIAAGYPVLYISRDSGNSFTSCSGIQGYKTAVSGDGMTILTVSTSKVVHRSIDGGVSWEEVILPYTESWSSLALSFDGLTMGLASTFNSRVIISSDRGVTWSDIPPAATGTWDTIGISDNGLKIVVGGRSTGAVGFRVSSDGGNSWNDMGGSDSWFDVNVLLMNGTGSRILALGSSGYGPYLSEDGGITWIQATGLPDDTWTAGDMSTDGFTVLTGGSETLLYLGE